MAVPVRIELLAQVMDDGARLVSGINRLTDDRATRLEGLARGLPDPARLVNEMEQRLDDRVERLGLAKKTYFERREAQVEHLAAKLIHPRQQLRNAEDRFSALVQALKLTGDRLVQDQEVKLAKAASSLRVRPIKENIERGLERVTDLGTRLNNGLERAMADSHSKVNNLGHLLDSYSHKSVLSRGYAVVRDGEGQPVTKSKGLKPGDGLEVEFADGRTPVMVSGSRTTTTPVAAKAKPRKKADDGRQGELL
jgi:exodeoxyribonuclease VII large subunit